MAHTQGLTEKAQQAVLSAQRSTRERRLAQLETEVLLQALVTQDDGVVPQVLQRLGVRPADIEEQLADLIDRLPKLQYESEARPSLNTAASARTSIGSPSDVPVPWAST